MAKANQDISSSKQWTQKGDRQSNVYLAGHTIFTQNLEPSSVYKAHMISVELPVATYGPSTPTTSKSRFRDTVTTNNNEFFNAYK